MPVGVPIANTPVAGQVLRLLSFPPLLLEFATNYATIPRVQAATIPASSNPFVVSPALGRSFAGDRGVVYSSNGTALTRCTAVQTGSSDHTLVAGEYTYDPFSGTYWFAAADAGLGVQISFSDTDGSGNVNWSISANGAQIGGSSMPFLPADSPLQILYQLRGTLLEALKNLTMAQCLPSPALCAAGSQRGTQQLPAPGAGFYQVFEVDALAVLPSNPGHVGL